MSGGFRNGSDDFFGPPQMRIRSRSCGAPPSMLFSIKVRKCKVISGTYHFLRDQFSMSPGRQFSLSPDNRPDAGRAGRAAREAVRDRRGPLHLPVEPSFRPEYEDLGRLRDRGIVQSCGSGVIRRLPSEPPPLSRRAPAAGHRRTARRLAPEAAGAPLSRRHRRCAMSSSRRSLRLSGPKPPVWTSTMRSPVTTSATKPSTARSVAPTAPA